MNNPRVSIIMGSDSDLPVMKPAAEFLESLNIPYELTIVSAHRTPDRMIDFAQNAHKRGIQVIVAGAGGAAHLPGMGDSILSILQMPSGIPVATVALNGGKNAGILAATILGSADETVRNQIAHYKSQLTDAVMDKVDKVKRMGYLGF